MRRMLSAVVMVSRTWLIFLFSVSWTLPGEYVNPTTRKQAERDLLALRKRLVSSVPSSAEMNKTALDAMGIDKIHIGQLVQMEEDAQRVLERLRARPGRPRKQARRLDHLDRCLGVLVGSPECFRRYALIPRGVAYGPFIDLLKAVFEACGITASAEARAKAFISKFCRPRRELEMRQ